MNSQTDNNIAFRLPNSHLRELNRLADEKGKSRGRLAKQILMGALADWGRLDSISHHLCLIERAVDHLIEKMDRIDAVERAVGESRASLAMAATRLLVEATGADLADAVAWSKEVFGVVEED